MGTLNDQGIPDFVNSVSYLFYFWKWALGIISTGNLKKGQDKRKCPGKQWSHCPWKFSKNVWMWHWRRTGVKGIHGGVLGWKLDLVMISEIFSNLKNLWIVQEDEETADSSSSPLWCHLSQNIAKQGSLTPLNNYFLTQSNGWSISMRCQRQVKNLCFYKNVIILLLFPEITNRVPLWSTTDLSKYKL